MGGVAAVGLRTLPVVVTAEIERRVRYAAGSGRRHAGWRGLRPAAPASVSRGYRTTDRETHVALLPSRAFTQGDEQLVQLVERLDHRIA